MQTYISLLRGINVSGQKKIKMADLKYLYESCGFQNVITYIQSGNVIFQSDKSIKVKIAESIETAVEKNFGYAVSVLVKSYKEIKTVINRNPFGEEKLYITFLFSVPPEIPADEFDRVLTDSEKYKIEGDTVYFYCPDGYGKTKFSNNFIEKRLNIPATTRNWNTVNKLAELSEKLI